MTDIEPWIEGGAPAEVLSALRAARREAPAHDVIERCVQTAALGAVGLIASSANGAAIEVGRAALGHAGVAASGTALTLVKWGAGGLLAGSLFAGGAAVVHERGAPEASGRRPSQTVAVGAGPSKPALPVAAVPGENEPARQAEAPHPPPVPSAALVNPIQAEAGPDAELKAQLELVQRARAAVDAGSYPVAAELLREYERRFGASAALAPEARYLRLEAFAASGRSEDARRVARDIIARDAKGPHVSRALEVLDEK